MGSQRFNKRSGAWFGFNHSEAHCSKKVSPPSSPLKITYQSKAHYETIRGVTSNNGFTSMPYICVIRQSIRKEMSKSNALEFAVLLGSEPAGWRFASLKRTSFVAKARSLPVPVAAFSISSKLWPDSK